MNTPTLNELLADTRFFSRREFPPGRLFDDTDPEHFATVIRWREACGVPLNPSPWVSDDGRSSGCCRFKGSPTSQHYARGRLAQAGDYFPAHARAMTAWLHAIRFFGGVGLYLDTQYNGRPRRMVHVDSRTGRPLWWVRKDRVYVYESVEPARFWKLIEEAINYA